MKYVLLLSFSYKKFKNKTGLIKININDRLIDSITLDRDVNIEHVTFTTRDKKNIKTQHFNRRPEKVYYYEIDTNDLLHEDQKNTLSISVKNDNNNYTNGFMTADSVLSIQNIWFLPYALFDISKIQHIHNRLRKAKWNKYNYSARDIRLRKDQSESMKKLYHEEYYNVIQWEKKASLKNKSTEYTKERWLYRRFHCLQRGQWPGIVHPLKYVNISSHKKNIPNYSTAYSVGGSFDISLPIHKKHKIFSIRQRNYKGAPMISDSNFLATMIEILQGSPNCNIINKSRIDPEDY